MRGVVQRDVHAGGTLARSSAMHVALPPPDVRRARLKVRLRLVGWPKLTRMDCLPPAPAPWLSTLLLENASPATPSMRPPFHATHGAGHARDHGI